MEDDDLPDMAPLSVVSQKVDAPPSSPHPHPELRLAFQKTRRKSGSKVITGFIVVKKELGQGAYGKVILGKEEKTEQLVALKKMSRKALLKKREFKHTPGSPRPVLTSALDKVYKEIGILKQITHPNVIKLLQVIDDSEFDTIILVLEYASGEIMQWDGNTSSYSSKHFPRGPFGGLPIAQIRKSLSELVAGLSHLHSLGIIHRDIKSENLLVMPDGTLKICDFGEADQFFNDEAKDALCKDSKGTHHFFAPETCDGKTEQYNGYKVDVWAAGVTLYSWIFGKVPFFDENFNTQKLFDIICTQPLSVPKDLKPDSLRDVLLGMLDRDPQARLSLTQIAQHPFLTEV